MGRLREYYLAWRRPASPEPPANFMDISVDAGLNEQRRCLPRLRRSQSSDRMAAARPQSRGVSWLDAPTLFPEAARRWPIEEDEDASDHCRHCNMRVRPAASKMWHERQCRLAYAPTPPELCELCGRRFLSFAHARNHLFYGCTPIADSR